MPLLLSEARRLSEPFLAVRVDYLKFDGRLTFSELTFSSSGARLPFTPVETNAAFGRMIDLDKAPECLVHGRQAAAQIRSLSDGLIDGAEALGWTGRSLGATQYLCLTRPTTATWMA